MILFSVQKETPEDLCTGTENFSYVFFLIRGGGRPEVQKGSTSLDTVCRTFDLPSLGLLRCVSNRLSFLLLFEQELL